VFHDSVDCFLRVSWNAAHFIVVGVFIEGGLRFPGSRVASLIQGHFQSFEASEADSSDPKRLGR